MDNKIYDVVILGAGHPAGWLPVCTQAAAA